MPKKIIPVPSDFARPKPGAYLKKTEANQSASKKKSSGAPRKFARPGADRPNRSGSEQASKFGSERPASGFRGRDGEQERKKKMPPSASGYKKTALSSHPDVRTKPAQTPAAKTEKKEEKMPLNKYIAHCGICSRREAIELIKQGLVKVNERIEKEPGYKVLEKDVIYYEDKKVVAQTKLVYYLLNKPKDFITTTDDPEGRKTVMDLFKNVTDARIFPVGRLDRNTTGLLLMTNDGDLTQKLSHPKHNTKKVYQVGLDRPLTKSDYEAIAKGLLLEDGLAEVDEIAYINPKDKREIGIEIHSGRNRIVRRIFEHLQYEVKTLDRVIYAGLTKKNIPRGKFRELEPHEVVFLKHYK
jgi:23S rRNA pseudouridine2605 synthase